MGIGAVSRVPGFSTTVGLPEGDRLRLSFAPDDRCGPGRDVEAFEGMPDVLEELLSVRTVRQPTMGGSNMTSPTLERVFRSFSAAIRSSLVPYGTSKSTSPISGRLWEPRPTRC